MVAAGISPGCVNCYAEKVAARFCGPGLPYEGLVKLGRWNGEGQFAADKLTDPLHWRKPKRVFIDSMSDLFYEEFSDEQIAAVFGVMAACPQHTFQVLTKRPARARRWFEGGWPEPLALATLAAAWASRCVLPGARAAVQHRPRSR